MTESVPEPAPRKPGRRRPPARRATLGTLARNVERDTGRLVVSILEVLGGVRTPSEAAEGLGVSLPRYYALEARALEGLLEACRRRSRGPRPNPERQIVKLEREIERLQGESARQQALLRIAQRSVGLPAPERGRNQKKAGGKRRRRRKPTARALRLAAVFRGEEKAVEEAAGAGPGKEVKDAK